LPGPSATNFAPYFVGAGFGGGGGVTALFFLQFAAIAAKKINPIKNFIEIIYN
jgi:hypothetical protein